MGRLLGAVGVGDSAGRQHAVVYFGACAVAKGVGHFDDGQRIVVPGEGGGVAPGVDVGDGFVEGGGRGDGAEGRGGGARDAVKSSERDTWKQSGSQDSWLRVTGYLGPN